MSAKINKETFQGTTYGINISNLKIDVSSVLLRFYSHSLFLDLLPGRKENQVDENIPSKVHKGLHHRANRNLTTQPESQLEWDVD